VSITICDVGPRDGLQNEDVHLAPAVRAELISRLVAAGLKRIETVSFVNPTRVPQMAGAEEVVVALEPSADIVYAGLVLNGKGYDRLVASGLREAHLAFACTEEFNRRNQNASVDESASLAENIIKRAHSDDVRATVTLAVAFGCPFEGPVESTKALALAERMAAGGADEISFADTVGVGVPQQATELVSKAISFGVPVGVHLHNTRNTGLANAQAALDAGATIFDASVGGTGGCPFAPRATGNIATEDLVYLLHHEGVDTGIDLDALIDVAQWLSEQLGKELAGGVYRAGNWPD